MERRRGEARGGIVTARAFAMTDPGVVRRDNEDGILVARAATGELLAPEDCSSLDLRAGAVVLAISDGMGGANAGEVASALTLASFREHLAARLGSGPDVEVLRSAIDDANTTVWAAASSRVEHAGMGATLVAAMLHHDRAEIALIGDCRAYVLRSGQIARLTRDQSFVQALLDSGVLTPDAASAFPHRNVVLQAIGTGEPLDPSVSELPLRRGDRLLLCSDGLTNELSDAEIAEILGCDEDAEVVCRMLVAAAKMCGGRDNVSVAVAFLEGDDLPPPSRDDVPPPPPPSGRFRTRPP